MIDTSIVFWTESKENRSPARERYHERKYLHGSGEDRDRLHESGDTQRTGHPPCSPGKRIRARLDTGYRGSLAARPRDRKSFFAPEANRAPPTFRSLAPLMMRSSQDSLRLSSRERPFLIRSTDSFSFSFALTILLGDERPTTAEKLDLSSPIRSLQFNKLPRSVES